MENKNYIKKILSLAFLIGYTQVYSSVQGLSVAKFVNFISDKYSTKVVSGEIVMPAHDTNSCWMNSAFSAFSNFLNSDLTQYLLDFAKFKGEQGLERVVSDLKALRYENNRHKLSKETKAILGYCGKKNTVSQGIFVLNEMMKGSGLKIDKYNWRVGSEAYLDLLKGESPERVVLPRDTKRITYFLSDMHTGLLRTFDHVYCLHAVKVGDSWNFYQVNDKGTISYSANWCKLSEQEATALITKKATGVAWLTVSQVAKNNLSQYRLSERETTDGWMEIEQSKSKNLKVDTEQLC